MALGALDIIIAADTAQLRKGMDTAVGIMQSSTQRMESFAKTAGASIAGYFALNSLANQANAFIQTAGKFEQYATSLKVLSGSAKQADQAFAWVKEFTAKTPYTLDQTMEAFIRLNSYGIKATDGSLKTLGDTAAAMGKPLMSAVEAMADAMTGQNERLKEFGIRASKSGDTIAYSWMDSSGKAKQQIVQNNAEIIKSTLEAIFNEKYAGMMDEQSKTWVGMVSNLEDSWTSFKDTLVRDTGALDFAKSSIESLSDTIKILNENIDSMGRAAEIGATMFAAYKVNGWINAGVLALEGSFLGAKSGVDKMLASTMILEASAMRLKNFLAVNSLTLTVGVVLTGSEVVKSWIEGDRVNPMGSKVLQDAIAKSKALQSVEAQANSLAENYTKLNDRLNNQIVQRASLVKSGIDTKHIDKAISDTKTAIKDNQKVLDNFNTMVLGEPSVITQRATPRNIPKTFTDKKDKLADIKPLDVPEYQDAHVTRYYEYLEKQDSDLYKNMIDSRNEKETEWNKTSVDFQSSRWADYLNTTKEKTNELNTVFTDAFNSMEDSVVKMFMTGKFEAEDFFNTIAEGLIRMQIRNSITQPLTTAIGGIDFSGMFSGMFAAYDGGMIPTYAVGGYTGDGGKYEPKGVVHGGEYVIPQWMVQKSPALIGSLESTRKRGFADGGFVSGNVFSSNNEGTQNINVHIHNESGQEIEATKTDVSFDMGQMVLNIWVDAATRNKNGIRDVIRGIR